MRIELTFPDQSQETTDLKSGTGTSSATSPILFSFKKSHISLCLTFSPSIPESAPDCSKHIMMVAK